MPPKKNIQTAKTSTPPLKSLAALPVLEKAVPLTNNSETDYKKLMNETKPLTEKAMGMFNTIKTETGKTTIPDIQRRINTYKNALVSLSETYSFCALFHTQYPHLLAKSNIERYENTLFEIYTNIAQEWMDYAQKLNSADEKAICYKAAFAYAEWAYNFRTEKKLSPSEGLVLNMLLPLLQCIEFSGKPSEENTYLREIKSFFASAKNKKPLYQGAIALANFFQSQNKLEKAKVWCNQALGLAKENRDQLFTGIAYLNIAEVHLLEFEKTSPTTPHTKRSGEQISRPLDIKSVELLHLMKANLQSALETFTPLDATAISADIKAQIIPMFGIGTHCFQNIANTYYHESQKYVDNNPKKLAYLQQSLECRKQLEKFILKLMAFGLKEIEEIHNKTVAVVNLVTKLKGNKIEQEKVQKEIESTQALIAARNSRKPTIRSQEDTKKQWERYNQLLQEEQAKQTIATAQREEKVKTRSITAQQAEQEWLHKQENRQKEEKLKEKQEKSIQIREGLRSNHIDLVKAFDEAVKQSRQHINKPSSKERYDIRIGCFDELIRQCKNFMGVAESNRSNLYMAYANSLLAKCWNSRAGIALNHEFYKAYIDQKETALSFLGKALAHINIALQGAAEQKEIQDTCEGIVGTIGILNADIEATKNYLHEMNTVYKSQRLEAIARYEEQGKSWTDNQLDKPHWKTLRAQECRNACVTMNTLSRTAANITSLANHLDTASKERQKYSQEFVENLENKISVQDTNRHCVFPYTLNTLRNAASASRSAPETRKADNLARFNASFPHSFGRSTKIAEEGKGIFENYGTGRNNSRVIL